MATINFNQMEYEIGGKKPRVAFAYFYVKITKLQKSREHYEKDVSVIVPSQQRWMKEVLVFPAWINAFTEWINSVIDKPFDTLSHKQWDTLYKYCGDSRDIMNRAYSNMIPRKITDDYIGSSFLKVRPLPIGTKLFERQENWNERFVFTKDSPTNPRPEQQISINHPTRATWNLNVALNPVFRSQIAFVKEIPTLVVYTVETPNFKAIPMEWNTTLDESNLCACVVVFQPYITVRVSGMTSRNFDSCDIEEVYNLTNYDHSLLKRNQLFNIIFLDIIDCAPIPAMDLRSNETL